MAKAKGIKAGAGGRGRGRGGGRGGGGLYVGKGSYVGTSMRAFQLIPSSRAGIRLRKRE